MMSPRVRKIALAAHLTFSVGWLGAVVAFVVPAVAAVASTDATTIRASFTTMSLMAAYAIVPLAAGALLSGVVSSLGTQWGLFRYYWVVIKLALTVVAAAVLLTQLPPIRDLARVAANPEATVVSLREAARPLIHAVGGLVVLLMVQVLGVFKPRGMTRYGWRKKHEGIATGEP